MTASLAVPALPTTGRRLLSDRQIALMRRTLARSYEDTAEVRRMPPPERRRDRSGGTTATDGEFTGFVDGRLTRGFILAREQAVAGALTNITSAVFSCAPDADIRPSDRLVITNRVHPEWPPVTLEVVSAEVRRTIALEQVVTCTVIGGAPPPPTVPLAT